MKNTLLAVMLMSLTLLGCNGKQENINVDYNVDTLVLKESNEEAFIDNDTLYFIINDKSPKTQTLVIIDESDNSQHEISVNTKKELKINDKKIEFIRSEFEVLNIDMDSDDFGSLNRQDSSKDDKYECSINSNNAKIYRHGSSSWTMTSKHSYNIKLDEAEKLGNSVPEAKSYNLIANDLDKTLMRSYIANELAENLKCDYTVDMEYVTLYVNKKYNGLYLLTSKPKAVMESDISVEKGDYVFGWFDHEREVAIDFEPKNNEFDAEPNLDYFANIELPDCELDKAQLSDYEARLQELVDSFGKYKTDNIDMESWARYYWLQEITKNYDAWYYSNYCVCKDNKFYAGAPWDFDRGWQYGNNKAGVDFETEEESIREFGFYKDLFCNLEFSSEVNKIYDADVEKAIKKTRKQIVELYGSLEKEATLDYNKCNSDKNADIYGDKYKVFGTSYEDAYNRFLNYYDLRASYILCEN